MLFGKLAENARENRGNTVGMKKFASNLWDWEILRKICGKYAEISWKRIIRGTKISGIPGGIGKLLQLTVLHLSNNQLELVPEGLSRYVAATVYLSYSIPIL